MFKFSCANAIPLNLYFCLFERVEIFFLAYSAFFCIEKEKFSRKNLFFSVNRSVRARLVQSR